MCTYSFKFEQNQIEKKIRFFDEIKPFHYFILVEHRMSRSFQLTYLNIKLVNSLDFT